MNNQVQEGPEGLLTWYHTIPPYTRGYFTLSLSLTLLTTLDVISPFSLYYNYNLIMKGQVWRLLTCFCYFGTFSIDFLFHQYFLVRYSRLLEQGEFVSKPSSFLLFLLFGAACMLAIAPWLHLNFLGSSFTFMMLYVWGRRNPHTRMQLFGVAEFGAPYLPIVMLGMSVLLGNQAVVDVLGIVAGHGWYFGRWVYPEVATIRDWRVKKPLEPPAAMKWLCGDL
mmetsp:Transcript_21040/g.41962  ORF Transcript_21040/g.41962 Transcript_21040/m.41962 type:complete len:223 (-) Transcript_21040:30-698(-)